MRDPKRDAVGGFTLVQMAVVGAIVGLLTLLIAQALADLSRSQAFTRGQFRVAELADRIMRGVARDLTYSVRLFTDGDDGAEYLGKLAYPSGEVMAGSRLATLTNRGYFDADPPGEVETGNMMLLARFEEQAVVQVSSSSSATGTKPLRIDTMRMVVYYLRKSAVGALDLGRWGSVPLAHYKDILIIVNPVDQASALSQLYAQGLRFAWDTDGEASNGLFQITAGGAMVALPVGSVIPGDPAQQQPTLAGLRNARVAPNGGRGKYSVPLYATAMSGGFPGGFEVKIDGPTTGKLALIRLVLRSGGGGTLDNGAEVVRFVSCREG